MNQQLKDYINQQTKVGVSSDVIKTALLDAGWQESDINEAMAGSSPSAGAGISKPVDAAKPAGVNPPEIKTVDILSAFSKNFPGAGAQSAEAKLSPASFMTSDIFQSKDESMFQSKGAAVQPLASGNKPQSVSSMRGTSFLQKPIVPIILGAVSLVFLAGAGILYAQNSGLQAKLNSASGENASLNGKLKSLESDKIAFASQVALLNQTVSDLGNQLSIFAAPAGTSTAELPISVKGTLGGGGKSPYSLTTSRAVVVYVKNSKDAKVDAMLKPLAGNQVEISGTHGAGSNYITVTSVDGKPLEQNAATSTDKKVN